MDKRVMENKLLTPEEAAEYLRVTVANLNMWRSRGIGPRYIKLTPRNIRYTQADLLDYVSNQSRTPIDFNKLKAGGNHE